MKNDLEALRKELEVALGDLDGRQTQLRPLGRPDKWSIQQIAGHLLRTYAATEKAFDSRIAKGQPTAAKVTATQRVGQFVLLRTGYFPRGRVAPEMVSAPAGEEAEAATVLVARITAALFGMNNKLIAAEALFGAQRRSVTHMILGPLGIDQWAKFHLVHGRHHIRQIAVVRKQHGV